MYIEYRSHIKNIGVMFFTVVISWLTISNSSFADEPKPAVDLTSLFRADMYPTGFFNISALDFVFTPQGADIQVDLKSASGDVIQSYKPSSPNTAASNNAFSRYKVRSSTRANLSEGDYLIEAMVDGAVATRLPFSVYKEKSSDPFASNQEVHYNGAWQKLGYFHFVKARNFTNNVDYQSVNFRMWSGLSDLPAGTRSDQVTAQLTRDGTMIAHSKKTSGALTANSEINRLDLVLFEPHDRDSEANVLALSESDLVSGDHSYQLTIARQSDDQVLRSFTFESKDGALVPMPRNEIGHTPQHEYLAPRALVQGTQNYEFETVYWMQM